MPLVFAENEATESGVSYADRTGISYQYPDRYRNVIQPGERFVYYKGRKKREGGRAPQVYFGSGVVGATVRDVNRANRFNCDILDYWQFSNPVPFKDAGGEYFETGAKRRGYFQPGVRIIAEKDFKRILDAAEAHAKVAEDPTGVDTSGAGGRTGPGYASPVTLKAVEEFAIRVALDEIRQRCPNATMQRQSRNNPGFDVLMQQRDVSTERIYVEVKGTTRAFPQFFITEGELRFSHRHANQFCLIVVYSISLEAGTFKVFWHEGPVSLDAGFHLSPVQWACEVVSGATDKTATSMRALP